MADTIYPNLEADENHLPKVVILKPPPIYRLFESEFSLHFNFLKAYESPLSTDKFLAAANAAGVAAIFTGGFTQITAADVLDHLPSLRCIVSDSTGLNHIDLAECRRRGIAVAYAGDVFSDDCADFAVGLLIDVFRKISATHRKVRNGDGSVIGDGVLYCLGHRLRRKRIGIVGLGNIGSRIAKRLEAGFECRIAYNSRRKKGGVPYPYYRDVCELAAISEVLIVCCSLTDQTRHLINKEVLSALGKEGVIINIARGPIIEERELVRFLVEGKIAGAGLDVFEDEPNVPEELVALGNVVVLSPHVAFRTTESVRHVFELVKANLEAFFSNNPLLSPAY